jgi:hypothetical protein
VQADLVVGNTGEFTVWVDGRRVADKAGGEFPAESAVVDAVRAALSSSPPVA